MKKTLACLFAGAFVSGCSVMHFDKGPPSVLTHKPCKRNDPQSCTITVSVSGSGGSCVAKVDYSRVDVERDNGNALLFWKLDDDAIDAGYRFAKSSVVFVDWQYDQQWQLQENQSSNTLLVWKDKNTDGQAYAYAVVVFKKTGGYDYEKCVTPDPWIHNF